MFFNESFIFNKILELSKKIFTEFIAILFLLAITFLGCGEDSISNSAAFESSNNINWVILDVGDNLQVNNSFTVNKIIDGELGGSLTMNQEFKKGEHDSLSVKATIKFPDGAFRDKVNISMTNNLSQCLTTFTPSMTFHEEAIFNITYEGVDLTNIDLSTLSFAYIANDGSVQFAAYEKIALDTYSGTLSVTNAKIPHFSRYGFVNKNRGK